MLTDFTSLQQPYHRVIYAHQLNSLYMFITCKFIIIESLIDLLFPSIKTKGSARLCNVGRFC